MENRIFYTTSYDDIIESIANICKSTEDNIKKYLSQSQPFQNTSVVDIELSPFFNGIGIGFRGNKELYEIIKFDSCVISHLTTRITEPNTTDVYYLAKVLTESTDISKFLATKGLTFKRKAEEIITYYNGEIVEWDNFKNSYISRIKARLRVKGKYMDNCVNGFLFNHLFWEDSNAEHITNCPEIVSDICYVLHRNDIVQEWKTISKSYALGFLADVKDIIFDNYTNYTTVKSKVYLIYKYVIYYLVQNYHGIWNPRNDNTIIRLLDNQCVSKDKIIGFYEIER